MKNIVKDYFEFYEIFNNQYSEILKRMNIGILNEFLENKDNIIEFHKKYIQPNSPKIVMCGINPGRRGAGISGIPFIDTLSLLKMLPSITNPKKERSAQFLFSIIDEEFGIDEFYRHVHVTNMSWLGFYKLDKRTNLNYNKLPNEIQNVLIDKFLEEMDFINPDVILPIGDIVNWELLFNIKVKTKLKAKIGPRLFHPASPLANRETYIATLLRYWNTPESDN